MNSDMLLPSTVKPMMHNFFDTCFDNVPTQRVYFKVMKWETEKDIELKFLNELVNRRVAAVKRSVSRGRKNLYQS